MSRRRASNRSIRARCRRSTSSSSSIFSVSARRSCSSCVRRSARGDVWASTRSMSASRPSRSSSRVGMRAADVTEPVVHPLALALGRTESSVGALPSRRGGRQPPPPSGGARPRPRGGDPRQPGTPASARSNSCSPASRSAMTRVNSCSARLSSRSTPSSRAVREASAARCSRATDSRSTDDRKA